MATPRWLYFCAAPFMMDCAIYAGTLAAPVVALQRFGANSTELGWLGTASGAGYAAVALLAGWWSDAAARTRPQRRRQWALAGALAQVLVALALLSVSEKLPFLLLATLQTVCVGLFWAPLMGLMSEQAPPRALSRELGRFNFSWAAGGLFGALGSGWMIGWLGPQGPFWLVLVMAAGVLAIILRPAPRTLAELHGPGPQPAAPPRTPPRARPLKHWAWVAMGCGFFVASLMIYLFPKRALLPPLNFSPNATLALQGVRMGGMLLAFVLMGRFAGWHFRRGPYHLIFVLLLAALALIFSGTHYGHFVLGYAAFGTAAGIGYVLSAYYSMLSPERRGGMIAVHEALLSTGSTLGPLFGSLVIASTKDNLRAPYLVALLPLLLLWAITGFGVQGSGNGSRFIRSAG